MATAPSIIDYLTDDARNYFEKVKEMLDALGIAYELDPTLVRGLDYYNHTTFEIMGASQGAISTLAGGGRYNRLVSELGGPETPGIGFALSIERLLIAMETEGVHLDGEQPIDCFIATIGETAERKAPSLLYRLRKAGLSADKDYMGRKIKAQFKQADREKARFVVVIGGDELEAGAANVKKMSDGTQQSVPFDELADYLKAQTAHN
jgi:histidyl-tRNA synthetase